MHRPRIIGNDQVDSLDKRAQSRKGKNTGQRVDRPPRTLLHMTDYTLDQFPLILGPSEEYSCPKLFNQQVNNLDIHLPWIGTRRHATSRMHHNQSRATARNVGATLAVARLALARLALARLALARLALARLIN